MRISSRVAEGVLYTVGMSVFSSVSGLHPIHTMHTMPKHKVPAYAHWPYRPPLVWLVHSLCAHHLPSTSGIILHCTRTSAHTPSPAALPHLDVPVHPCFPLPGGIFTTTPPYSPQSPSSSPPSFLPTPPFSTNP